MIAVGHVRLCDRMEVLKRLQLLEQAVDFAGGAAVAAVHVDAEGFDDGAEGRGGVEMVGELP